MSQLASNINKRPAPINITEHAIERLQELVNKREKKPAGIRISVRTGGCSGKSYVIAYADEIMSFEEVIQAGDVKVIIDPKAIMYLLGAEMDYVEEKFKSGFTFKNPNEKGRCGCGESFSV